MTNSQSLEGPSEASVVSARTFQHPAVVRGRSGRKSMIVEGVIRQRLESAVVVGLGRHHEDSPLPSPPGKLHRSNRSRRPHLPGNDSASAKRGGEPAESRICATSTVSFAKLTRGSVGGVGTRPPMPRSAAFGRLEFLHCSRPSWQ
jgi:hypothetical protein